jgi:tetratricopeptide (TPR) repeat protein
MKSHSRHWVVLLGLAFALAPRAEAASLPGLPDWTALARRAPSPPSHCNAGVQLDAAERLFFAMPADERQPLKEGVRPFDMAVAALECDHCILPYSEELAIPPTEQRIPSSKFYWTVSAALAERGASEAAQGKLLEAEKDYQHVLRLGLLVFDDPGISFIQQFIGLHILADAAQGLGDLDLARGNAQGAAECAEFVRETRRYREDAARFLRETLSWDRLTKDPVASEKALPSVAPLLALPQNRPLRAEVAMYLGLAGALLPSKDARAEAQAALERASREAPDSRMRKLSDWALGLTKDPKAARSLLETAQQLPPLKSPW